MAVGLDKIFPAPGRYRIQIAIAGPDRHLKSRGTIERRWKIEIEEPTGFDQAARTYIEATGAARFLTGYRPDNLVSAFEAFAAQFADTAYGGYANLILAGRKQHDKARALPFPGRGKLQLLA